jgi:putative heme iron utilization protein
MYHDINEVKDDVEYLLKNYQQAAMGTNSGKYPDVTKVTPVLFDDDNIYLLLSDLSNHTRNIREVSNTVSLYFAAEHRHATQMNNARVTLYGTLELADKSQFDLGEFDKRDKGASFYGNFGDFNVWKFVEKDRLYVEGFGKAYK